MFFTVCCLQGVRFGYHFTFCLSEGANILNGFGFNGYDEKKQMKWDRLASVNLIGVEFAQSPFEISQNWNMTAGHWLKYYVYLRLDAPTSKPTTSSATITNLVSALWHGFYPGYFIHFLTASLILAISRIIRAKYRDRVIAAGQMYKSIYNFLGFFLIKNYMGYSMASFVLLTWDKVGVYLSNVSYIGHIALAITYVIVNILPAPVKDGDKKKKDR